MKRDMELIRNILLTIEADTHANIEPKVLFNNLFPDSPGLEFYNEKFYEHIWLLKEANFIDADLGDYQRKNYLLYTYIRITNDGHEYISSIRNDSVWEKIKVKLGKESINAPFEIFKQLGIAITLKSLG